MGVKSGPQRLIHSAFTLKGRKKGKPSKMVSIACFSFFQTFLRLKVCGVDWQLHADTGVCSRQLSARLHLLQFEEDLSTASVMLTP